MYTDAPICNDIVIKANTAYFALIHLSPLLHVNTHGFHSSAQKHVHQYNQYWGKCKRKSLAPSFIEAFAQAPVPIIVSPTHNHAHINQFSLFIYFNPFQLFHSIPQHLHNYMHT